jgi:hypothetical protein
MKYTWKIIVPGLLCFYSGPVWADTSEEPFFFASPAFQSVDHSSGNTSFTVSNTGATPLIWSTAVVSGDDWLTITDGISGSVPGTITCKYDANIGPAPRTAPIRIFPGR